MSAMATPNTTDLPTASARLLTRTACGSVCMKKLGVIPSVMSAASMPPSSAISEVHTTSSGMATASASARGSTSLKPWAMPSTRMASSSSVTRITPICAVMAEPERPAISTAASSGPSSRISARPKMSTMKASAPNCRNTWLIR